MLRSWCRWHPAPLDMRDIPVGNIDPTMSQLMSDLTFGVVRTRAWEKFPTIRYGTPRPRCPAADENAAVAALMP
jgi:hypothetical protein